MMDGMFSSPSGDHSSTNLQSATKAEVSSLDSGAPSLSPRGGSPDDQEKEERRKAAQKVLGKQG